jgi:two-component system OmpR family sensor kinase
MSAALTLTNGEDILEGTQLPPSARLHIVDQNGVIIDSTQLEPGDSVPWWPRPAFEGLDGYLSTDLAHGQGRRGAATRVTDANDSLVGVVVSGEADELVSPLLSSLFDQLAPVGALTLITLVAVWLLSHRWVVRPVEALVSASTRLAGGDMSARVEPRTGVTEFDHLASAFNDMASAREQAMRAKDDFLGLVSHELRTPITTALGNAQVLWRLDDAIDRDTRRQALADIHDSAIRLNTIIENLLVLARLERGIELERQPVALLRVAQSVAADQMRRHPEAVVAVRGDDGPFALAGETYVEQVIQNLTANAIKYGGLEQTVDVIVESRDGMAIVRVLDRGPGINEAEREAIFEPFYRSERTASRADGIGIGLSVCARLVHAMGGVISSRAREGGGCEFSFTLPVAFDEDSLVEEEAFVRAGTEAPAGGLEAATSSTEL